MTSMAANGAMKLGELPALEDVPPSERMRLFRQKLKLCCVLYDFTDMRKQVREKEAKRNALLQIVEYISAGKVAWDPSVVADLLECVGSNIFRHLGRSSNLSTINANGNAEAAPEDDEPMLEPSWPHMQLVYEILLRFVLSKEVDSRTAKEYFSKKFMIKLLNLFDSEDPRERDYLKTILHRIYGKSMALRSFIRRSINDMFYTFVYETESLQGVGELLEILGSIINGFALPLKPEHQNFLERALIPLHTAGNLAMFHQQLAYCTTQFVEKDPQTAEPIIMGLLKYWPVTASAKEILFLNELEEIIEMIQMEQFAAVMRPLFLRISQAVCSSHFQVSQRALYLWNNEALVRLVSARRAEILPLIFGALYRNCENHWHSTVQTLTYNVLKLFMEMDSQLFDQCSAQFEEREGRAQQTTEQRQLKWAALEHRLQAQGPM
ncbi:serine/threonine protein phosphatase 2A [Phytophthora infestans T30-4]|uniref:Serine/threonine protein phosphatase 2A regulatory subunit n=2 Tax=Phytophthora infestans TaxID=4787 RepID=D0N576_PHYIT|nr:serine/threonine protein phosphatase 2A [Phytophthora infestans T30-4]EEY70034.1 serine/threonine protein phosphatase 2A [Phytophthora infestans T30-4]KAF4034961.1 Protein phosphatase 2A regulatory B subunit (B56 family) [Phytophthora infestans]KAF4130624.1 Protein phosphatase 2A regulatory B subunit (B56 family) [Phytophthora infestans]|eukprot:XP_002998681.1 serine/threonine protein phosphatase 2A [Phytophthora infestans T30-4]